MNHSTLDDSDLSTPSINWLDTLNPGDTVIVRSLRGTSAQVVQRVTPTQIVLPHDRRYKRAGGYLIGEAYASECLIGVQGKEAAE